MITDALGAARASLGIPASARSAVLLSACLALSFVHPPAGLAQNADPAAVAGFYRGKTVTIVSGSEAGGGYDLVARVLGRYLGRHIPGNPQVIVQNIPGAASVVATNYVYTLAAKDGTVLAGIQRSIPFQNVFSAHGVRYDATKAQWIGSVAKDFAVVAVWHTAPQQSFADLLDHETIVGSVGVSGDTDLLPRVLNNTIGTRFRIASGYPGQSQIVLAMQRGEVQGVAHWSWSDIETQHADWLASRTIRPLLQLGLERGPSPYLTGVPLIMDVARNDEQRDIFRILMSMLTLGRPFFVAPEVPQERVQALRDAFVATMNDPEFVAEAGPAIGGVAPVSGADMQRMIAEIYATPASIIASLRQKIR
jgi:tripartite-type tricarboxylate transporter receptor subunit TctC